MTAANRPSLLRVLLPVLGCLGFAAAWVLLARMLQSQASWLAPLAALDVAWMLQLGRIQPGWTRIGLAMATTLVVIGLANWGIAATEIGRSMGLLPWESALRLGSDYAWQLIQLANTRADLVWYALGLALAGVFARR
ncbi:hypothetical protein [Thermomonas sp.]|uniref:hypothetical protein n=1 Tax=Thermomonas sp. TaxID=1971895 RepID=UPI0024885CC1|nr:hypothetical protein [Thermomonas sp.]MDI1254430.1 hypothetical protein [Thermomonas sp.]